MRGIYEECLYYIRGKFWVFLEHYVNNISEKLSEYVNIDICGRPRGQWTWLVSVSANICL